MPTYPLTLTPWDYRFFCNLKSNQAPERRGTRPAYAGIVIWGVYARSNAAPVTSICPKVKSQESVTTTKKQSASSPSSANSRASILRVRPIRHESPGLLLRRLLVPPLPRFRVRQQGIVKPVKSLGQRQLNLPGKPLQILRRD